MVTISGWMDGWIIFYKFICNRDVVLFLKDNVRNLFFRRKLRYLHILGQIRINFTLKNGPYNLNKITDSKRRRKENSMPVFSPFLLWWLT